jgi:hypothetical protein
VKGRPKDLLERLLTSWHGTDGGAADALVETAEAPRAEKPLLGLQPSFNGIDGKERQVYADSSCCPGLWGNQAQRTRPQIRRLSRSKTGERMARGGWT